MLRIIAALFLLLASAAAASAQVLSSSVWQSQRGALLKVVAVDPATGNFTGVFVSGPAGTCQGVPYDLVGRVRGPRVVFQTSRNWTTDCRATTVWSGRFVSPTILVTRGIATYVAPNSRVARVRGTEVFQRI
jgi:Avidin family